MKRCILVGIALVVLILLMTFIAFADFNLSALPEPGRNETYLATNAKHMLIGRASRRGVPAEPARTQASITAGNTLYGAECAACHGLDGHTLTDTGRWMYPRAADLASPAVQQYSDPELFWIVKNGIRLSGMPAFGKVETDEHIWNLVTYVRTLNTSEKPR